MQSTPSVTKPGTLQLFPSTRYRLSETFSYGSSPAHYRITLETDPCEKEPIQRKSMFVGKIPRWKFAQRPNNQSQTRICVRKSEIRLVVRKTNEKPILVPEKLLKNSGASRGTTKPRLSPSKPSAPNPQHPFLTPQYTLPPSPTAPQSLLPSRSPSPSVQQVRSQLFVNLPKLPFGTHKSYNDHSELHSLIVTKRWKAWKRDRQAALQWSCEGLYSSME